MKLFDRGIKIHTEHLFCGWETQLVGKGRPVIGHGYRKNRSGPQTLPVLGTHGRRQRSACGFPCKTAPQSIFPYAHPLQNRKCRPSFQRPPAGPVPLLPPAPRLERIYAFPAFRLPLIFVSSSFWFSDWQAGKKLPIYIFNPHHSRSPFYSTFL